MSYYRRSKTAGGSYFFTLITYRRRSLFTNPESRRILHDMIIEVRNEYPFQIDALVLLPEHLHCIWTLPMDDANYSKRWSLIKSGFSRRARALFYRNDWMNKSKEKHRESTMWQRRFWEHQIRDAKNFCQHIDYILIVATGGAADPPLGIVSHFIAPSVAPALPALIALAIVMVALL